MLAHLRALPLAVTGATARRPPPGRAGRSLLLVAGLWLVGALCVLAGAVSDFRGRASGPEAPLRTYLAAVTAEDLDAALAELLPEARPAAADFVAEQLGNEYAILGLGTRQPSLLDRLRSRTAGAERALLTVQLDITLVTGETWRTTTTVAARSTADGWYLERAPLQPTSDPPPRLSASRASEG
jgi:hypothetical protein